MRYLERFATTGAHLRRVLLRRALRDAAALELDAATVRADVDAVVARVVAAGLVDDRLFAASRARRLNESGRSPAQIRATLLGKGLDERTVAAAWRGLEQEQADPELAALWPTPAAGGSGRGARRTSGPRIGPRTWRHWPAPGSATASPGWSWPPTTPRPSIRTSAWTDPHPWREHRLHHPISRGSIRPTDHQDHDMWRIIRATSATTASAVARGHRFQLCDRCAWASISGRITGGLSSGGPRRCPRPPAPSGGEPLLGNPVRPQLPGRGEHRQPSRPARLVRALDLDQAQHGQLVVGERRLYGAAAMALLISPTAPS